MRNFIYLYVFLFISTTASANQTKCIDLFKTKDVVSLTASKQKIISLESRNWHYYRLGEEDNSYRILAVAVIPNRKVKNEWHAVFRLIEPGLMKWKMTPNFPAQKIDVNRSRNYIEMNSTALDDVFGKYKISLFIEFGRTDFNELNEPILELKSINIMKSQRESVYFLGKDIPFEMLSVSSEQIQFLPILDKLKPIDLTADGIIVQDPKLLESIEKNAATQKLD